MFVLESSLVSKGLFLYLYPMDFQEIIAFVFLGFALAFLYKKFFGKKKPKKNCGSDDCGCH